MSNSPCAFDLEVSKSEENEQEYQKSGEGGDRKAIQRERSTVDGMAGTGAVGRKQSLKSGREKSLTSAAAEEISVERSTLISKVDITRRALQERNVDKDGYETWVTEKKTRKKTRTSKKSIGDDSEKETEEVVGNSLVPTGEASKSKPHETLATEEEGGQKKKGEREDVRAEETVVITEKEYRLLQSLKEKSLRAKAGILDNEMKGKGGRRKEIFKSKEVGSYGVGRGRHSKEAVEDSKSFMRKERDDRERRKGKKGKADVGALVTHVYKSADVEEVRQREKQHEGESASTENCDSSDSDFQRPPKRCGVSESSTAAAVKGRRKIVYNECDEGSGRHEGSRRGTRRRVEFQEDEDYEALSLRLEQPHELQEGHTKGTLLRNSQRTDSDPRRTHLPLKPHIVYPFENSTRQGDVQNAGVFVPSRSILGDEGEDDIEEATANGPGMTKEMGKRLLTESEGRAARKRKQAEKEVAIRKREAAGEKPYFIMVNSVGKPYGDGMSAWKTELNKLCRALDPSIRDVRQQPHHKIEILKRRLTDNFEYSGVISDRYLLPVIGHRVSTRRNELINAIKAGRRCPKGVDAVAWENLTTISESPSFKRKSAAMQYANSCRQNLGRTGPGGEIGVRESLKESLGRSPDPDEIQAEMSRDKGYGGKKKKQNMACSKGEVSLTSEDDVFASDKHSQPSEESQSEEVGLALQRNSCNPCGEVGNEPWMQHMELVKKLQTEIEYLKSRVDANAFESSSANREVVVQSFGVATGTSSQKKNI